MGILARILARISACMACAALVLPSPALASDGYAPVTFDMASWGRRLAHWQLDAANSGEFWRVVEGGNGQPGEIRKFRFTLDAADASQFTLLLKGLERTVRGGVKCRRAITDMAYGSISWTGKKGVRQSYSFDFGCLSAKANRAIKQVEDINALIGNHARLDAAPFAVERPGS